MSSATSSSRFGKHRGLSATLIVLAVVAGLLSPLVGLIVGLIAVIHAQIADLTTTRNILIVMFLLGLAGFALFGTGGSVEGGLLD